MLFDFPVYSFNLHYNKRNKKFDKYKSLECSISYFINYLEQSFIGEKVSWDWNNLNSNVGKYFTIIHIMTLHYNFDFYIFSLIDYLAFNQL